MKLIIAGSRSITDYNFIKKAIDFYLQGKKPLTEIVSGGAKGVDKIAERYAKENNIPIKIFPADWEKFGKAAGAVRNLEMANYGTHCLCFWDGKSSGTKIMYDMAKKKELPTELNLVH